MMDVYDELENYRNKVANCPFECSDYLDFANDAFKNWVQEPQK